MSHAPERKEKNCLNCGNTVIGRFCHICGQENVVPKESFGNLVLHFFADITHFDGKFFDSARYLLFRPGFLSREYVSGRRARYLNPVRMYVFTSAIFFLVFFMLVDPGSIIKKTPPKPEDIPFSKLERNNLAEEYQKEFNKGQSDTPILRKKLALLKDTSREVTLGILKDAGEKDSSLYEPTTWAEYDSSQKALPESKRDGWFTRAIKKKFKFNTELQENPETTFAQWSELFLHKLPYLLFISLPLFALILKLLYVRRTKNFYYADHAIFSIHHFVLSFVLLLFIFLFSTIEAKTGWGFFKFLWILLLVAWPVHLYAAMYNFYKQGWLKTLVKFLLLNILGLFTLIVLFGIFFTMTILLS